MVSRAQEHAKDMLTATKHPVVHDTADLVPVSCSYCCAENPHGSAPCTQTQIPTRSYVLMTSDMH
eukprot:5983667-Amphidinium_carterae.1